MIRYSGSIRNYLWYRTKLPTLCVCVQIPVVHLIWLDHVGEGGRKFGELCSATVSST